jgi:hypothetical protein
MEAMDNAVRNVILVDMVTIISVPIRPTLPTTHPNRRYIITPRIVRIEGVNTPPKVPSPWVLFPFSEMVLALTLFNFDISYIVMRPKFEYKISKKKLPKKFIFQFQASA